MSRYIAEYHLSAAGGKITLPACSKFLGIEKVGSGFVLITEVWGNPAEVFEIDVKVFHKEEYMLQEAIYIGHCLAATTLFHFSYTHGEVLDLGGDGGSAPEIDDPVPEPVTRVITDYVKPAGGMEVC